LQFTFGEFKTRVFISSEIKRLEEIAADLNLSMASSLSPLVICDENTSYIADKICGSYKAPRCTLKSGEELKNWETVQSILQAAFDAGLGRDGIFIAVGGGVIGDLSGFAASIYMRGCRFVLVSTTLLGMVDASVGGKTGFDIFNRKNLAGTFYPAKSVYMPLESLATLPEKEIKSGMAELIKTAVLKGAKGDAFLDYVEAISCEGYPDIGKVLNDKEQTLLKCIEKAVKYKGSIVSKDLYEKGQRALLNLGHTFAHALEASAGLGQLSHGEAVAWGIIRACELGIALGITPRKRAKKIKNIVTSLGYEIGCPHPLVKDSELIFSAMNSDKKKKQGKLSFIVPDKESAVIVVAHDAKFMDTVNKVIKGELSF